ncbi:MAG: flagellar hook-basal body complex protein FliE [Oscillospiraceae bacterium]|nr:flagellar hook-basal body complex protein FliE [Oscillospiraceae bacterium]
MEFVPFVSLDRMEPMTKMKDMNTQKYAVVNVDSASFLDIFRGLVDNVIDTNEQVDRDMIDLMLGNIDNLAQVQANIQKANMAVEMLVTVKNEVVSAYNSIINMQV